MLLLCCYTFPIPVYSIGMQSYEIILKSENGALALSTSCMSMSPAVPLTSLLYTVVDQSLNTMAAAQQKTLSGFSVR